MISKNGWKLISYPHAQKLRLYNIAKDPQELKDLSRNPEYTSVMTGLKADLKQLQSEMGDDLDIDNPPAYWDPTIKKNKKKAGAH